MSERSRKMKRIFVFLLIVALVTAGCAKTEENDTLSVVATLFPQYDFAVNIAGDVADVELLLDLGTDAHSYEPTPLDIVRIANADLFIYTGNDMEIWAAKLLSSPDITKAIERGSLKVLDLSGSVDLIPLDGHEHGEYDAHIWTSPKNAVKMSASICEAMAAADGENADAYRKNFDAYAEKLDALDTEIKETVLSAKLSQACFGGSFAFTYLFEEYGLSHVSVYEGCAAHAEPSAADIGKVVTAAESLDAEYIIYDTEAEKKTAEIIANECGIDLLRMHAVHNISRAEFDAGEDYISLMQKNIQTLGKALN